MDVRGSNCGGGKKNRRSQGISLPLVLVAQIAAIESIIHDTLSDKVAVQNVVSNFLRNREAVAPFRVPRIYNDPESSGSGPVPH